MNTLIWLGLLITSAFQVAEDLPGEAFARPDSGTVLRSNSGDNFPGVLTLDGETVVRLGTLDGVYREVFVAAGFPIYMHGDYVAAMPQDAQALVQADRVNMRLLPATAGNIPIGQLSRDAPALVLLGEEGEWPRVLAPMSVPLYALDSAVTPVTESDELRAAWTRDRERREERRQRLAQAWRATDPGWQAQQQRNDAIAGLENTRLTLLDAQQLDEREATLARLSGAATGPVERSRLAQLSGALAEYRQLQRRVAERVEEIHASEGFASAELEREARILGLGFRFNRYGESVTRKGKVGRIQGPGESVVYTLQTGAGEVLKLTSPPDVADLSGLVGRQVTLTGRQLTLNSVKGPVMVVHRVLLVGR